MHAVPCVASSARVVARAHRIAPKKGKIERFDGVDIRGRFWRQATRYGVFGIHGTYMIYRGKIRGTADSISGCWVLWIECAPFGEMHTPVCVCVCCERKSA